MDRHLYQYVCSSTGMHINFVVFGKFVVAIFHLKENRILYNCLTNELVKTHVTLCVNKPHSKYTTF